MRPGITIQHSRDVVRDSATVRTDVTGFVGLILKDRWPRNVKAGDFMELPLKSFGELSNNPAHILFDAVTRRAIQAFFENGGEECRLFGICIESQQVLCEYDPNEGVFAPLLDRLRSQEDIAILVMPALAYMPVRYEKRGWPTVMCQPTMEMLLNHCREMNNRFLILDTPRDLHERPLMRWVRAFREKNSESASYGAVYYPWLMNGDETFPPSGSVAGIFARTDSEHAPFGVRWPPANQLLRGVTHPAVEIKWKDSGELAEANINPILTQPARGVVLWGARTLSKDAKWLHINSRRIVSFISEQLRRDSEWVVFENQRPELWQIIGRMVRARLDMLWGAGLLTGDQAGSEYQVQCDREINPPEVVDAGQVNVKVLVRPMSTAEYIVVDLRLGQ
ncbi:MAG: phage tail sheath family protein [Proteobacteria bacterium]|nr:phage tail sheath family protein [Pseudomonadota bacterium]